MNVQNSSLRQLTDEELQLVAGGNQTYQDEEIVVTGRRESDYNADWWSYDPFAYFDSIWGDGGSYDGGGGGGEPEPNPDQETLDKTLDFLDAKLAVLQDLLAQKGPNFLVAYNDRTIALGDLVTELSRFVDLVGAGLTIAQAANGDISTQDAFEFFFGMAVGAAAASASGSALVGVAMGYVAENGAELIMQWMEAVGDQSAELREFMNQQIAEFVQNNSDIPPGTYDNPIDMLRGMMGWPTWEDNRYLYQQ